MPKSKPKTAATHWRRIEPTQADLQDEILDRVEQWHRTDLVLKLHELHQGELCRIDTLRCWCPDPVEITQPVDRMQCGREFYCPIHKREVTIRRSLDPLMKTKQDRAELLERHPVLQGIRDGLYRSFFVFEAGAHFEKRSIGEHQPTALSEVMPSKDRPLRGLVIECINDAAAERAFDNLDEDAPWREGLQDLLNAAGELQPGWHGGRLTGEELHRRDRDAQIAQHRAFVRDLKQKEAARVAEEILALK
jgi:hypothetical protein